MFDTDLLSIQYVEDLYSVDNSKSIDLYHRAVTKIIWTTIDHSIKTLAHYFGFDWRDPHPLSTASIEWFEKWINSQIQEDRQRILDYNEDECIAMRVVLDGVRNLSSIRFNELASKIFIYYCLLILYIATF